MFEKIKLIRFTVNPCVDTSLVETRFIASLERSEYARTFRNPFYYSFAFFLIFTGFFLVGCDRRSGLSPEFRALLEKGTSDCLRIGLSGGNGGLNPILEQEENAPLLISLIHSGPLRKFADGSLQADLWEDFSHEKDRAGNLIVTGTWRDGLTWHDGKPFKIEDFDFSIESLKNPKNKSPYRKLAEKIEKIEHLDGNKKTRISFKGSSGQLMDLLAVGLLPSHLIKEAPITDVVINSWTEIEGNSYDVATGSVRFDRAPVGLGFYRIKKVLLRRCLLLERTARETPETWLKDNQSGIGKSFEKIFINHYYYPENLVEDLRGGKLDWATIPSEFAKSLEELKIPKVRFLRHPNRGFLFFGLNLRREPFNDIRFRRAIDFSINRASIRDEVRTEGKFFSAGEVLSSPASTTALTGYDPGKAIQILDEMGLKDRNGDGIREFSGKPLKIEVLIDQATYLKKPVAENLVKSLKAVGIAAELKQEPWASYINEFLAKGNFDSFILSLHLPRSGNWLNLWHSSQIPVSGTDVSSQPHSTEALSAEFNANVISRLNFTGFSSAEVDSALEKIDSFPDVSDYDRLKSQVEEILSRELPGYFLFSPFDVSVVSESLSGPDGSVELWEQEILFWKKQAPKVPGTSG